MYLFTFRARIKPNSETAERFGDVGGAYANCWINFKDYEVSQKLAKMLLREHGWIPEKKTDESVIQKRFLKKKKDLQYYSEALKYGYTLVFNVWPKDAEDADVDYDE